MKPFLFILTLIVFTFCNAEGQNNNARQPKQNIIKDLSLNQKKDYEMPSQEDHLKYNELGLAVKSGNIKEVKQLLKNGADINNAAEDEYYVYGALYIAINTKDEAMVKFLIENKADINTPINEEGYSLLIAAINSKNTNIVDLLIKSGIKIETFTDPEGNKKFIPILEATQGDQSGIVKLLLEKGADPHEKTFEGFSAYDYAQKHNKNIFSLFKK